MRSYTILLILATAFVLGGCKHDYPSSTPKWLREKITQFKRLGHSGNIQACVDGYIRIDECRESTTGATLYSITQWDPTYIHYYDKNGQELGAIFEMDCNYYGGATGCLVGNYNSLNIHSVQLIWTPKHCD